MQSLTMNTMPLLCSYPLFCSLSSSKLLTLNLYFLEVLGELVCEQLLVLQRQDSTRHVSPSYSQHVVTL